MTRALAMPALHDFHEILAIAMCAVLCGGQGSVDMGLFAKAKEPFLRGFLKLENGVPSHDTFGRLFRVLDAEQFRAAFQRFMAGFSEQCEGVVAIDGKVLRRSFDSASGTSPLHMVSAWGCEQRLVLAQIATDAKSNEITAVPKLLEMLRLKETIVTALSHEPFLLLCTYHFARAGFNKVNGLANQSSRAGEPLLARRDNARAPSRAPPSARHVFPPSTFLVLCPTRVAGSGNGSTRSSMRSAISMRAQWRACNPETPRFSAHDLLILSSRTTSKLSCWP